MASPHVAGVAALLISQRPELTNNQVRQMLLDSASDLGSVDKDYYFGYGVVNAAAAPDQRTHLAHRAGYLTLCGRRM